MCISYHRNINGNREEEKDDDDEDDSGDNDNEKKNHTVIVDECQQDKCYMKSVLTHMECDVRCDAKEKYTFYAKNVNDGAGRRKKNKSFHFHFAGPIILIH